MDRLYAFYQDFDTVGTKLADAAAVYNKASDRLRGGIGKHSVVKKGEELKALGVKLKKNQSLPKRLQVDDELLLSADIQDAVPED
jgi:DNA anti-recombination protein RmuC